MWVEISVTELCTNLGYTQSRLFAGSMWRPQLSFWELIHSGINTIPSNTPKFLHVVVWLALWWVSYRISQQHVRTQTIPTHQHLIAHSMQGKDWEIWSCAVPSGRQMVDTQAVEPNEESQCPTCTVHPKTGCQSVCKADDQYRLLFMTQGRINTKQVL